MSQDIKIFLHHISRAFLVESYKGWSHIKLLAQWLFSMYKKSKNQLKIKKIKVGKMFPIKSLYFWPIYIFKRPCGLGAPGIFVFCSKLLNLTWLLRGCFLPLILWRHLWSIFIELETSTADFLLLFVLSLLRWFFNYSNWYWYCY